MIHLAIIEDDPMLREELTEFFAKNGRINCILVVESISRFQQFFRDFMQINVVLLDINLPDISGLAGIPVVRRLLPDAEIVMHTVVNDYDTIFKCICAGANGYLLKDGNLEKLAASILDIETNGGCALTPSVARRILTYFQPRSGQKQPGSLSEQEMKISRLLIDGFSYQEVADTINITLNGVRYHVKNIYAKLHINSRGELLKRYREGHIGL
ncbi:MAG: response regulator transcription factor [Thermoanaerobaculia bacterium]|nr:response regulator transcription factor [Thermoanaerobaculia bacterium]